MPEDLRGNLEEAAVQWGDALYYYRGAKRRMRGMHMICDFEWTKSQHQFLNCDHITREIERIAKLDGRTPAVLLTTRDRSMHFRTSDWYIVPINFEECITLNLASAGAFGYVWKHSILDHEQLLSQLGDIDARSAVILSKAETQPEDMANAIRAKPSKLADLLEVLLSGGATGIAEVVTAIVGLGRVNPAIRDAFVEIARQVRENPTPSFQELRDGLNELTELKPELVKAFGAYLNKFDSEGRQLMLGEVVAAPTGILDVSKTFSDHLEERLKEVESAIYKMKQMALPGVSIETDFQIQFERCPWILGLHYAKVEERLDLGGGYVDFIVQRYDGGYDIVEMKGPDEDIILPRTEDGEPSTPNEFRLGDKLSNALAQALVYKVQLRGGNAIKGILPQQDVKIIIVIGRKDDLKGLRKDVASELLRVLHDVEIIPYDSLLKRAEKMIENVRAMLTSPVLPGRAGRKAPAARLGA